MEIIRKFKGLGKNDAAIAGGKGASLGEMTNDGIPVPPGFVVLSESFEKFLDETDLNVEIEAILKKVNHKKISTVENASEQIQALILNASFPKDIASEIQKNFKALGAQFVAVRSSATSEDSTSAAWAGQLDSYLNTTQKDLLKNVKRCWASLFTPRAIFYRFEKNLNLLKISVAVVIQKMVQSEVSGIAFSVHPVTQDYNQIIIEAGFGLGEAIVSGSITPDSYVIEKQPRRIIDKNITIQEKGLYKTKQGGSEWVNLLETHGSKQALTDKEILELVEIILRIENHYGFPCDIEWAREKGKFYIVQSRPITTLQKNNKTTFKPVNKIEISEKTDNFEMYWSAQLSPLMATLLAECYTKQIRKNFKIGFDKDIIFSNGVKSVCYLNTDDREKFAKVMIKKFGQNQKGINELCKTIKSKADFIKNLCKKTQLKPTAQNYYELKKLFLDYNIYHITPRHLADFSEPKKIQKYLKQLSEARTYVEKIHYEVDQYLSNILSSLLKTKKNEILQYTFSDIENALNGDKLIKLKEVKNLTDFCAISTKDSFTKLNKDDAETLYNNITTATETSELKGTIAYSGVTRGKVRIILDPSKTKLFNEGDILVAEMTRPEYVPFMDKASAVVTDGGGALCHAAIIARELKKPCIIGTKIATQILHDGDLVEVDANNGVVRIVNQEKYQNFSLIEENQKERFLNNIKKIDWKHWLNRPYRVFMSIVWEGVNKKYFAKVGLAGLGTNNNFYQFPNIYYNKAFAEKGYIFFDKFFRNHRMRDLTQMLEKIHRHHLNELKKLTKNPDKTITEKITIFSEWSKDYIPFLWIVIPIEKYFNKRIAKEVPKHIKGDYSNFIGDISLPKKKNAYILMQDDLKNNVPLGKIQKKFGWIKSRDGFTDFYTVKELKEIKNHLEESKFKKVKIPPQLKNLAQELSELTYFRTDRTDKFYEFFGMARPLLKEIAKHLKIKFKDLEFYDVRSIILNNPKKYHKSFSYASIDNKYIITNEVLIPELKPQLNNTVKGLTAFKGKIKGIVKIVTHPNDLNKVNKGDILVTQMTLPSFISAMQKASAFVTDEGSITCHAAIIAREMEKPCIIGTKNATKILHDGDLVEVDATNGVINILKQK